MLRLIALLAKPPDDTCCVGEKTLFINNAWALVGVHYRHVLRCMLLMEVLGHRIQHLD